MKKLPYVTLIAAIIFLVVGLLTRAFMPNKTLFGLAALTYLRFTNTMLLLTINLFLFGYLLKKKE